MKLTSLIILTAALLTGSAAAARAQTIHVAFGGGHVTIQASEALATDVLAAWARTGKVEIAGAELLGSRRVTLALTDVDEKQALQEIVGDTLGFVATWKIEAVAEASRFAKITVGNPKDLPAPSNAPTTNVPEAKYTYYFSPDKIGPSLGVTSSPDPQHAPLVPETQYEYSAPGKAVDAPKLIMGEVKPGARPVVPETKYEYYVPAKAEGPKLVMGEVKVDTTLPPPEARFKYSVPNKIKQ